ncbi:hypothetical protein K402DRAFT_402751 [Aulographum hederae CBS 113979]|uniref:Uncharacterized protein n=1 Tax=Aulographum hederae CBS 113979 TaxID=1176131 RepID=A0A6G1H5Y0_9PEZI|nr:hypothetical protein K402DRAFT_402751 [Aulographum hederae CBS 113979]
MSCRLFVVARGTLLAVVRRALPQRVQVPSPTSMSKSPCPSPQVQQIFREKRKKKKLWNESTGRRTCHHPSQSSHFSSCLICFILTSWGWQGRPVRELAHGAKSSFLCSQPYECMILVHMVRDVQWTTPGERNRGGVRCSTCSKSVRARQLECNARTMNATRAAALPEQWPFLGPDEAKDTQQAGGETVTETVTAMARVGRRPEPEPETRHQSREAEERPWAQIREQRPGTVDEVFYNNAMGEPVAVGRNQTSLESRLATRGNAGIYYLELDREQRWVQGNPVN